VARRAGQVLIAVVGGLLAVLLGAVVFGMAAHGVGGHAE
jgi:hypothetical protein